MQVKYCTSLSPDFNATLPKLFPHIPQVSSLAALLPPPPDFEHRRDIGEEEGRICKICSGVSFWNKTADCLLLSSILGGCVWKEVS